MKTYKTWEVIKMLTENSKLRFKRMLDNETYVVVNSAELIPEKVALGETIGWLKINLNDDWTLIQQSVDFMTAVKAYKEGKTIRCEVEKRNYKREYNKNNGMYGYALIDNENKAITSEEILDGTWYIEE